MSLSDEELVRLLRDLESDRVERKQSAADGKRIREAICAFANDLPDHRSPGVLFVGVDDEGSSSGLEITDELLLTLSNMRDDGNIVPLPSMLVEKRLLDGRELAVVAVQPSEAPPVRYKGRVWIRVGPRRAVASPEEERRLGERRRAHDLPFDLHPVAAATIDDLNLAFFRGSYLPSAVDPEQLAANERTIEQQLSSLRFLTTDASPVPTVVGLLAVGISPADFVPGAYVQFLRISGNQLSDPIADQKELHGPMSDLMSRMDDLVDANIEIAVDIESQTTEQRHPDYPKPALQQLIRNAVMHRNYETSNAPTRITWFADRIEIQNPGGPFGQVTVENFGTPGVTDYRNPHVAETMRNLGYVQRFGVGIQLANQRLMENSNREAEFEVQPTHVLARVWRRQ